MKRSDRCRHKDNKKVHGSGNGDTVAGPPINIVANIPQPLSVVHESSPQDDERYSEEKDSRKAQLTAAKRLNKITIAGVAIGVFSLLGVYLTLIQNRNTLKVDQRAWVGIATVSHHNEESAGVNSTTEDIVIKVINTGKTPTHNATVWLTSCMQYNQYVLGDADRSLMERILAKAPHDWKTPIGICQEPTAFQIGSLPPGNPRTMNYLRTKDMATPTVARTISVFGRITYLDVFSPEERETTFCYFTFKFGEAEFSQCPTFNDMK